ncbi:adenosine kinase [Catenovulum adriaticum]|uniref:Adenosine kinase n=1 Tax=Catenovulum adriaticum TaxID=2984846 RepID=A0ABY7AJF7_9ALTE|nr:adenosine kinase [Catenovulum sp. TS8]WAJ69594.1 adenosine kinase [Catenovulum sp. TS8]
MRKYQVYGLGNALVDQEFEVTNEFLAANKIEKGFMTLLDEAQHIDLLNNLTQEFGLIKRVGGGSAANSMVAISQFGGSTFYACKVGDDETGEFYSANLKQAGVHNRVSELNLTGQTGKCMVMVTPDAERTMNTYLGITADLSENELFIDELGDADYLYIEGYLVPSDTARQAIAKAKQQAKQQGCKIAVTFSDPSMVKYFKAGVEEVLGTDPVDILFCNEEEALTFTGETELGKAADALLKRAKQVAITRGANGASIYSESGVITAESPKVTAVDSNGAGDMFAGAYLYAISQNWTVQKAASFACAAAAKVVTQFGPRISEAEQQSILTEFKA